MRSWVQIPAAPPSQTRKGTVFFYCFLVIVLPCLCLGIAFWRRQYLREKTVVLSFIFSNFQAEAVISRAGFVSGKRSWRLLDWSFKFTYLRQPLNRYTFKATKIKAWVEAQCLGKDVLNLFAGPTRLKGCFETTNDLDETFPTDYKMDALVLAQFLAEPRAGIKKFDRVLLVPPYSYRKKMELPTIKSYGAIKQVMMYYPRPQLLSTLSTLAQTISIFTR
jgi:hypothetical protein